jgi:hypothetical protein
MTVYEHKLDHRPPDWNKGEKSKWTVLKETETEIFFDSHSAQWLHNEAHWAIKVENDDLLILGEDHRPKYVKKGKTFTQLIVAKFVQHRDDHWHGYPVNTLTDYPPTAIFQMWEKSPGIKKKTIVKLNRAVVR